MKKLISLVLLFTLLLSFVPMESRGAVNGEDIRVGLRYDNSALAKITIKSPSGFILGDLPLPGYVEIIASVEGGKIVLKDKNGVLLTTEIANDICLKPYGGSNSYLSMDGRDYRGCFELKHLGSTKVTVINVLPLEEYLYGVVHREIGMRNPPEALKAQAITARTYAKLNMNRHRASGFDICAGTHCQVYGGINDEYESTTAAVDDTRGLMIYKDGKPVDTYYSKNSGGHTQNSEDVWSASLSHLRGKPDPYCPDYPWHATINYTTLRQMLKQGGMDPGNIHQVKITGRNSAQAVSSMVVSGDLADVTLLKTKVRELLGASLIRSTHFTIGQEYERPDGTQAKNNFDLKSGSKTNQVDGNENLYVLGSDGTLKEAKIKDMWVSDNRSKYALSEFIKEASSGSFEDKAVVGGSSVTFYGLGYGHGVGMAQDGAIEMAKNGMTYMDILNFYYTGIEVY